MKKNTTTPAEEVAAIRRKLGHLTLDRQSTEWLNTRNTRLNAVLGAAEFGVPYGKMIEIYGPNSHGKTMLALLLAALAQEDGAKVAWIDLERSFDRAWVEAQGVHYDDVYLFEIGVLAKEARLQTAQELCEEVELWMEQQQRQRPKGKLLIVVDSIAAMMTEEELEAGTVGQNMRTQMSLPSFLSKLLRKWVALAANYNAMMLFINQIRTSPGKWGNPSYAPGGNAAKHYCSVRVHVQRVSGGRLMQSKQVVGLRGVIKNIKNKAGGGSVEGGECGYLTYFGKKSWEFPSVQAVREPTNE